MWLWPSAALAAIPTLPVDAGVGIDATLASECPGGTVTCALVLVLVDATSYAGFTVDATGGGTSYDLTIQVGSAWFDGPSKIVGPAVVTIEQGLWPSMANPPALDVSGGATVLLVSADLNNLSDGAGAGAIVVDGVGTSVELAGGWLTSNSGADGGAISVDHDATLIATGATFDNNDADGDGGAIWAANGAEVTLDTVAFASNQASNGWGGAIYAESGASVTVTNPSFDQDYAGNGGDLAVLDAIATITGGASDQSVAGVGGSIYANGVTGSTVTVSGTSFGYSYATLIGGAIAFQGRTDGSVDGATFDNANAEYEGGAIALLGEEGLVSVTGSRFDTTYSQNASGGALFVQPTVAGVVTLADNTFQGTTAQDAGGAVAWDAHFGSGQVVRNTLCDVSSYNDGGGFYVYGGPLTIANTVFDNVYAGNDGGLLWADGGAVTMTHATVTDASASNGALAAVTGSGAVDFRDSLLASGAIGGGGELQLEGGSSGSVVYETPADADWLATSGLQFPPSQPLPCGRETRIHPDSPWHATAADGADWGAYGELVGPWSEDGDGDGDPWYYDCDDGRALVGPSTAEVCDLFDQDCDGLVDEPEAWMYDRDHDHFGDPASVGFDCLAAPDPDILPATASWGDDCDDTNATVWPDAPELCDGLDQDCNLAVDEGLPTGSYGVDADADGFTTEIVGTGCAPAGFSLVDPTRLDCDDRDPALNPDERDIPGDGVDQDCDGDDDAVPPPPTGPTETDPGPAGDDDDGGPGQGHGAGSTRADFSLSGGTCGCAGPRGSPGPLATGSLVLLVLALRRRAKGLSRA